MSLLRTSRDDMVVINAISVTQNINVHESIRIYVYQKRG
jgi:hypothetical protein